MRETHRGVHVAVRFQHKHAKLDPSLAAIIDKLIPGSPSHHVPRPGTHDWRRGGLRSTSTVKSLPGPSASFDRSASLSLGTDSRSCYHSSIFQISGFRLLSSRGLFQLSRHIGSSSVVPHRHCLLSPAHPPWSLGASGIAATLARCTSLWSSPSSPHPRDPSHSITWSRLHHTCLSSPGSCSWNPRETYHSQTVSRLRIFCYRPRVSGARLQFDQPLPARHVLGRGTVRLLLTPSGPFWTSWSCCCLAALSPRPLSPGYKLRDSHRQFAPTQAKGRAAHSLSPSRLLSAPTSLPRHCHALLVTLFNFGDDRKRQIATSVSVSGIQDHLVGCHTSLLLQRP